jgi:hypothetical protein
MMGRYLRAVEEQSNEARKQWKERPGAENDPKPGRSFVHFKSAVVTTGTGTTEISNLRVKLRDVSAWSLAPRNY